MRSQSAANLQNFYATQRFQPRPTEAEQMMQAKRRLAAQRERDLRNYHQEQQYNRSMSSNTPSFGRDPTYKGPLALLAEVSGYGKDRVMSPSAMSEDDRRELIARQHRALYTSGQSEGSHSEDGVPLDEGNPSRGTNPNSNGASAPGSNAGGTRGPSPMAFDPFGQQNGKIGSDSVQAPPADQGQQGGQSGTAISPPLRSRTNSASSPSSKSASFSLFENAQAQSSRTSASSPGGSPPRSQRVSTTPVASTGVAPIGTRPTTNQSGAANNGKRASPPLNSPLYNLQQENDPFNNANKERSSPAPPNNSGSSGQGTDGLNWGGSRVWGLGSNGLSVWG